MVFSFDSLAALLLLAVGIGSWRAARGLRASIRIYLRFAAVLLAALAASMPVPAPDLAFTVLLLTSGAASVALALAFCFPRRVPPPWLSATVLAAAFATGLIASLAALPLLAFVPAGAAAAYMVSGCVSRVKENLRAGFAALLGTASLALGALAMMDDGLIPASLFYAAALALVTRALQKPVEGPQARIELLVGAERA